MDLPKTADDFKAFLKSHARHGVRALEGWIAAFNKRTLELQGRERSRLLARERFVTTETNARYERWIEAEKARHAAEAAADFDREHPSVDAPSEIVPPQFAAEIVKRGKDAKDGGK